MEDEIEVLIEQVRKYPYLYDTSENLYKDVVKKAETWMVIAEELHITSESAKIKWKNLRDNYLRYKKSVKGVTGQGKKYHKWPWSKHMKFLDYTLTTRSTSSNISSVEIERCTSLDSESSEIEEHEPQVAAASPEMPPPPLKKKMKVRSRTGNDPSQTDAVNKVIDYLQNRPAKREYDGIDHLFLSYADTFRKFQPTTQAILKMELATLFARTEMRELGIPLPSPIESTTNSPLHFNSSHSSNITSSPFASECTSPVYHSMHTIGSPTNDSHETARHLYINSGGQFQSD